MIVEEGVVKIHTGKIFSVKGPGKVTPGFYNPQMVFSRDAMVSFLKVAKKYYRVEDALDALASTGVRGIRMAKEVGMKVVINDWNRKAYELIKKNIVMNKIDAEATCKNALCVMAERRFGYIDIDPYGSPVPFLDVAMQSVKNYGILGVTATDTANLSGSNPKKCYRRYMAKNSRSSVKHEVGIRILLGYIGKTAAKFDKGIEPLLSIYHGHHYRVFVAVYDGAEKADKTLSQIKMAKTPDGLEVGPLWVGKIHQEKIVREMRVENYFQSKNKLKKMIDIWANEKGLFFYELHYFSSIWKINTPPLSKLIENLKNLGYYASRTQFSPTGIKTNAPAEKIKKMVEKLCNHR